VADRTLHDVDPAVGDLHDIIAGVVDHIAVVAVAAFHLVRAGHSIQLIGGGVAGQLVVEPVAGAVDRRRAGQHQPLDLRGQAVAYRTLHYVDAASSELDNLVSGVVDHIGVVADTAGQRVGTGAAVKVVVSAAAVDDIISAAAVDQVTALAPVELLRATAADKHVVASEPLNNAAGRTQASVEQIVSGRKLHVPKNDAFVAKRRSAVRIELIGGGDAIDSAYRRIGFDYDRRATPRQAECAFRREGIGQSQVSVLIGIDPLEVIRVEQADIDDEARGKAR
jgi:hypothetical protein